MTKMQLTFLAGVLAASAMSPAFAADNACLRFGEINTWKALNDKTLIVQDNQHRKFRLSLIGTCYDLNSHEALGFRVFGVGLRVNCVTAGDQIVQRDMASSASRCAITKIEPYTAEMEAADKAAAAEHHGD